MVSWKVAGPILLSLCVIAAGVGHVIAITGDLKDISRTGEEITDAHLSRVTLTDSHVRDSTLDRAEVNGGRLVNVTVDDARLHGVTVRVATVTDATIRDSTVAEATLVDVTVESSHLRAVHLERARVLDGSIRDSSVDRATLDEVDLERVSLCRVLVRDTGDMVMDGCPRLPPWPVDGSFVAYRAHANQAVPDFFEEEDVDVRLAHRAGVWTGTCEGTRESGVTDVATGDLDVTAEPVDEAVGFPPLRGPTDHVKPGETVTLPVLVGCDVQPLELVVRGAEPVATTRNGESVTVRAWIATTPPGEFTGLEARVAWDAATGLVLEWERLGLRASARGELADTDAPVGGV